MTTTVTQDLIDPFTPRIEELLRERDAAHGIARPVTVLLCDLFIYLMRLMAGIAERARNGALADAAPVSAPDEPSALPTPVEPREIGLPEQRSVEAAIGGGTTHGAFEQPEMPPEIEETTAEAPPCEVPGVEQAAALLPRHVDNGCWPEWRGAGVPWTADAGVFRFDLKKWVLAGADTCVDFVTI